MLLFACNQTIQGHVHICIWEFFILLLTFLIEDSLIHSLKREGSKSGSLNLKFYQIPSFLTQIMVKNETLKYKFVYLHFHIFAIEAFQSTIT